MQQKCGYVALLGRPNAGKSTLLNALVGDKIAGVSRKPQTTRNRILGVAQTGEAQILFLDTPGLHRAHAHNLLNSLMNRAAMHAAGEADLLVYLVDAARGLTDEDNRVLSGLLKLSKAPVLLVAAKMDLVKRYEKPGILAALNGATAPLFAGTERLVKILPLSAKRPDEVQELKSFIAGFLPEGTWLFPADDLTDRPRFFICAELIREQIFRQLAQEIPYGTAVKVTAIDFKGNLVVVRAQIVASQKSHKPILLGKGGTRIKAIGTAARAALEKHFDQKVFLDLSVTVSQGWTDDQRLIAELAHLSDLGLEPTALS